MFRLLIFNVAEDAQLRNDPRGMVAAAQLPTIPSIPKSRIVALPGFQRLRAGLEGAPQNPLCGGEFGPRPARDCGEKLNMRTALRERPAGDTSPPRMLINKQIPLHRK